MTAHPHLVSPAPDALHVVSVSGGKDSTATVLALREAGIEARYVFADTGWEHPCTYQHLDHLREALGITIAEVGFPGGMRAKIRARAGFPGRLQRWCTQELKIKPLRAYHDALQQGLGVETVCVVGIRAEESKARARFAEVEDDDEWGGLVWRPILRWSIADVLAIHHRHGIGVNPLYRQGHDRVGCWPCVMSGKEEIRLIADQDPAIIAEIERLEDECADERTRRNEVKPGRYAHATASFFQVRHGVSPMRIREIVEWSRTDHGGRQLPLLQPAPQGGCMRWGLCDVAPTALAVDDDEPMPDSHDEAPLAVDGGAE